MHPRFTMHSFRASMFCLSCAVRRCGRLIVLSGLLLGVGCHRLSPARQSPSATVPNVPGAAAVRFLGNVRVIGTGGRFVLVEASAAAVTAGLANGQTLVCRSARADTATLRVSRERRPPFVVADVDSGTPHVGDEVYVVPAADPAAKPTTPSAAPPAPPVPAPPFRANPSLPPAS